MKKLYVVGFAFDKNRQRVALILKGRPEWQRGRLNGIGGKVEPGEAFIDAMVREFREESGYHTVPADWQHIHTMESDNSVIQVYRTDLDSLDRLQSMTDEDIYTIDVEDFNTLYKKGVPNIIWLVHYARRENVEYGITRWVSDSTTAENAVDLPEPVV